MFNYYILKYLPKIFIHANHKLDLKLHEDKHILKEGISPLKEIISKISDFFKSSMNL